MTEATAKGFTQEAFEAFLAARREPPWLVELRRNAWQAFQAATLPGTHVEEWRRTDIRGFRLEKFNLPEGKKGTVPICRNGPEGAAHKWGLSPFSPAAGSAAAALPEPLLTAGVDLAGSAVALDGSPLRAELDPAAAARGVLFGSLDGLLHEHAARIEPYLFTQAVDPYYDKFSALGAACWSGGMLLVVPKGVTVERPLHMFSAMSHGGVDVGHALIVLEEGAEATVLAETASGTAADEGFHCGAVEILVGRGARLRYVNLQNWGTGVWHFAHHRAVVGPDAALQWTIGALGSRLAKVNQHVALVGPGAHAQVNGVLFADGRQHLSYHTLQHHQTPHGTSDLLYKGALQGNSRIVWRGMIAVDRDAQQTDGYQRNDNLILSDGARVDSIPGLEIQADDVKCSHGATAGRVDDEQVFYAQTRGLTRKEAIRTIVSGFFQQVFDRITLSRVRYALGEAIGKRIREHD
jgi:Fe-S cluster assembly protein SufD